MTNVFLKINKDLFKLKLNPTEILILAQVMEYNTNTGDCFMSDKAFAEAFGVSDKTISREMKVLEEKGFIKRETKNVKGGKERHIKVNLANIEKELSKDKMSVDGCQQPKAQQTKCPLTTDNLSNDNRQNDLIKENLKEKEKENMEEVNQPAVDITSSTESFLEELAKGDCLTNPIPVEKEWIRERYNNHEWECYNTIGVFRWRVDGKYYTVKK